MQSEIFKFKDHTKEIPLFNDNLDKRNGYYRLGPDNKYYDYLIDLYKTSANHSSMVDNIVQRVVGSGFQSEIEIEQNKIRDYRVNEWFKSSAKNLVLYGGISTEIIWNTLHTYINTFNSLDLDKVRVGLMDEELEEPTLYFYSPYFSDYTYGGANKEIDVMYKFDSNENSDNHQILYNFGENRLGNDIYPRPNYLQSIPWIVVDSELPNYYMNLVLNNFMVSNILVVPFQPDEDDQETFEKGLKEKFVGTDKAASTMVIYTNQEGDNKVELINVAGDQGERKYDELVELTVASLARGIGIPSPMLAGLSMPGNLFGIADLPSLETMFNKQTIYPMRNLLLDEFQKINEHLQTPLTNFEITNIDIFDEKTT